MISIKQHIHTLLLVLISLSYSLTLCAQQNKIVELEAKLKKATTMEEQMYIYNQMALAALKVSADKVIEYATKANELGITTRSKATQAQALNLLGKGHSTRDGQNRLSLRNRRLKDLRKAERYFKQSLDNSKSTKNFNLAMDNLEHLILVSKDQRQEQKTIRYYQQFIDLAKRERGFGSASQQKELQSGFEKQQRKFVAERAKLEKEKKQLKQEIGALTREKQQLDKDKSSLKKTASELKKAQKATEQELSAKKEEVSSLNKKTEQYQKMVIGKDKEIKILLSEAQMDSIYIEQAKIETENAELIASRNRNFTYFLAALSALGLFLAFTLFMRFKEKNKANAELTDKNKIIEEEKKRSEELLLNILPASIADELKQYGAAKAKKHNEVTVLFTDFKNFTKISEQLKPDELVKELDWCFRGFDYIISQYNIEKIKTIGDAYMCATGFNRKRLNPALDMVKAALEIQEFLEDYKRERVAQNRPFFEARIGIHTGTIVAGVVGTKKFAYDIWGDTVNIASRIESSGEVGKVNISAATYNKIQSYFFCTYRGQLAAKNKGNIDMYFVDKARV